jgi:hypothetical protein
MVRLSIAAFILTVLANNATAQDTFDVSVFNGNCYKNVACVADKYHAMLRYPGIICSPGTKCYDLCHRGGRSPAEVEECLRYHKVEDAKTIRTNAKTFGIK